MDRNSWNSLAKDFDDNVCDVTRHALTDVLELAVQEAVRGRPPGVLIDLGCGTGTFIRRYRRHFSKIYGIDFADQILVQGKKRRTPKVTWICGDAATASRPLKGMADVTACFNVITATRARARARIWDAVANVTRSGGYALVDIPSVESLALVAEGYRRKKQELDWTLRGNIVDLGDARQWYYGSADAIAQMKQRGFKNVTARKLPYSWTLEGLRTHGVPGLEQPWDWLMVGQKI